MSDLPEGWRKVALGEVVESAVDGPFGSNLKTEHYVSSPGVRVIRLQNIGAGHFNNHDHAYISARHARTLGGHEVRSGDLLVASLGDENHFVARACSYPKGWTRAIVKADCFRLRPMKGLALADYLSLVLNSSSGRQGIAGRFQGVTRDRINLSELLRFRIPLPSLGEQRRIAEIIDALNQARQSQECLIEKLRRRSQGIAESLVEHLVDGKMTYVGERFDVKAGLTLGPDRVPVRGGRPYLRVANVQRAAIDSSDLARLRASRTESSFYALRHRDLLVVEGHANPDEIGRCAIVDKRTAGLLYQNHLFRLRAHDAVPEFGEIWLNSAAARNYWRRMCATSSGLYTINSRMLKALPFPDITHEEQRRIVGPLKMLESEIERESQILSRLGVMRAGVMEDLLTGRVRV